MNIIQKEEIVNQPVKKMISKYVSNDGMEWALEKDCIAHEEQLNIMKRINEIKIINNDFLGLSSEWYKPETDEQLELILKKFGYYSKYENVYVNDCEPTIKIVKIRVGEWINFQYRTNLDSRSEIRVYTLEYIKMRISKFLEAFKDSSDKGN